MKPTKGLKFLLPMLSDQDIQVIERYVAEQWIEELELLETCPPPLIWVGIADRIATLKQEAKLFGKPLSSYTHEELDNYFTTGQDPRKEAKV